jgi:ATP-dependent protease ClpP protease subunit
MSQRLEKERSRIEWIHDYGLDMEHFTVYLQGVEENCDRDYLEPGVEFRMANRLIKSLDVLTGLDDERPITISMKTCGGDWEEGMAIYDAIMAAPNPVTIVSYTHARSMSSIILQAANKRILMPHSTFMFHEGYVGMEGTPKQVRSIHEFNKVADEQMLKIYIDRLKSTPTGKCHRWSKKRIREWLEAEMNKKEDVYMTADEAVKMGFADEIFSDWATVTEYTEEQTNFK